MIEFFKTPLLWGLSALSFLGLIDKEQFHLKKVAQALQTNNSSLFKWYFYPELAQRDPTIKQQCLEKVIQAVKENKQQEFETYFSSELANLRFYSKSEQIVASNLRNRTDIITLLYIAINKPETAPSILRSIIESSTLKTLTQAPIRKFLLPPLDYAITKGNVTTVQLLAPRIAPKYLNHMHREKFEADHKITPLARAFNLLEYMLKKPLSAQKLETRPHRCTKARKA